MWYVKKNVVQTNKVKTNLGSIFENESYIRFEEQFSTSNITKIEEVWSTLMNYNDFQRINNVWKKINNAKWHNDLNRFTQLWLRLLRCVVSFLYYFNGASQLLQKRCYNE